MADPSPAPPTTIVVKHVHGIGVAGFASILFGILSIFVFAPIFVPLAIIFSFVALVTRQASWGLTGFICALVGFVSSPILMGMLGIMTLASVLSHSHHASTAIFGDVSPPSLEDSDDPVDIMPQARVTKDYEGANRQAASAAAICRSKRLTGEYKTFAESAICANKGMLEAYRSAEYPYMDLITQIGDERLHLSEKVDLRSLSENEARAQMAGYLAQMASVEEQRIRDEGQH